MLTGGAKAPPPWLFRMQKYNKKMEEKKKRGGKREGAGRKPTTVKPYMFYATQEVHDILEAVDGSRSAYICKCILMAAEMMQNAKKS